MATLSTYLDEEANETSTVNMGASASNFQVQTPTPATYRESHELDADILAASRSIPLAFHIVDKHSFDDLAETLRNLPRPREGTDLVVVVHHVQPEVVDALIEAREPHLKVLYAADEALLIVTLPGQIHSIINAWFIQFFGFHHKQHKLRIASVQNNTYHRPRPGSSNNAGKEPDLLVKRKSGRTGPALVVEVAIGDSERMPALRLDARWWLGNVDGVKVVLLVGYDKDGKNIRLEKWVNVVTVDRSTRSEIHWQKAAIREQWMQLSWTQTTAQSSPNSFRIDPQSNDPLLLGSAGDILDDITLPPSMDYSISSMDVQELVEDVYQNLSVNSLLVVDN